MFINLLIAVSSIGDKTWAYGALTSSLLEGTCFPTWLFEWALYPFRMKNCYHATCCQWKEREGECVLRRWVQALHDSLNLLNGSLALSLDFYRKSAKESLGEQGPTSAKTQIGASVSCSSHQSYADSMTKADTSS